MSKAEEKAMQYCCQKCPNDKFNCGMKLSSHGRDCVECNSFVKGYNQAEKDLELTWEDIKTIKFIIADMMVEVINTEHGWPSQEEFCKKILNRFNKQKGK